MNQNQPAEWKRILIEILKNEVKVSPFYMTHEMFIQQYQRALDSLRKIFHKDNVLKIDDGKTSLGKKKTYYRVIRNEHTERKLRELQEEGKIDKSIWFNYPRSEGGFIPPTFTRPPSNLPPDRNHKIYQITAENTMKKKEENGQMSLQI